MQLFVAIEGEKRGPFSVYQIAEMLRGDKVSPESLGWHQGMGAWQPLREIPALSSTIEVIERKEREEKEAADAQALEADGSSRIGSPSSDSTEAKGHPQPPELPAPSSDHADESPATGVQPVPSSRPSWFSRFRDLRPLSRFWARMFDYMIATTVAWLIVTPPAIPDPESLGVAEAFRETLKPLSPDEQARINRVVMLSLLIWHVIEAFLLTYLGTTPGKFLFDLRVREPNGARLSLTRSLFRSLYVFGAGFGFAYYQLPLFTSLFAFFTLMSRRQALWDWRMKLTVDHGQLSAPRVMAIFGAFFLLAILQGISVSP